MLMNRRTQSAIAVSCLLLLVIGFQNCGKKFAFSESNPSSATLGKLDTENSDNTETPDNPGVDDDLTIVPEPGSDPNRKNEIDVCQFSDIEKVLLNIKSIELRGKPENLSLPKNESVDLIDMRDMGLEIKATEDIELSEVRLVLNETGNKLISKTASYDLTTPSQQESGLKIHTSHVSLKKNKTYILKVEFETDTQFVNAGSKCTLKPVIHMSSLVQK
jgi:hypothetical protein